MVGTLRRFAHGAFVFLILAATSGSILAQEMTDRELRPAFDFTMIQMPVEIVSVRLNGRDVQPGEKIKGNDDWLQGLSFTLKNISDKPIAYERVCFGNEPDVIWEGGNLKRRDPNQVGRFNVIERYVLTIKQK